MAILSVRRIHNGRGVNWTIGLREYTQTFRVVTDAFTDGPGVVGLAAGIPLLGSTYSTVSEADTTAYLHNKRVEQDGDHPGVWVVTCEYTNDRKKLGGQPGAWEPNPLLRAPEITIGTEKVQRAVQEDLDGKPVVNSAGMPLDPGLSLEVSRLVVTVKVNRATQDLPTIEGYLNACNDGPFLGFETFRVKFSDYQSSLKVETVEQAGAPVVYVFWEQTFQFTIFEAVPPGSDQVSQWRTRVLDQGYYELNDDEEPQLILDAVTGQPLSGPSLLDENGGRVPAGGEPHWLEFNLNPARDFAALGLGV